MLKNNISKNIHRVFNYKLRKWNYKILNNDVNYQIEIQNILIDEKYGKKLLNVETIYSLSQDIKTKFNIMNDEKDLNMNLKLNYLKKNKISISDFSKVIKSCKYSYLKNQSTNYQIPFIYISDKDIDEKNNLDILNENELFFNNIIENSFNSIFSIQNETLGDFDKLNITVKGSEFDNSKTNYSLQQVIELLNEIFLQLKFMVIKYI